ncbi:hypothetical protein QAD02_000990 [Eretmocerus hayati]|uniref:Uncharacterized protein n=1 Tax=Eretmocerus hayati TaxID=131215 RepID=A0ACC2NGF3_9HYME|nr:hypothetical protein QAD02_000990 [Eretmocerus hayati]
MDDADEKFGDDSVWGSEADGNNSRKDPQDFQWAFGLNKIALNMIGLWPRESSREKLSCSRTLHVYLRIPLMILTMLLFMVAPAIFALIKVIPDLLLVIENLTCLFATITGTLKIFLLWYHQHALQSVLRDVEQDWILKNSPWEHQKMIKRARWGRLFTISGYSMMFGCALAFLLAPELGLNWRTVNNITDPGMSTGRVLPIPSYFPYDFITSPYYELTFTGQLLAAIFLAICLSVPDNLFGALVFHASAQCEILASNMSRLVDGVRFHETSDDNFQSRLRQVVDKHVYLIR